MIKDPQALIVNKKNWKDYYLFSLESPGIASQARPGQFIMARISAQPHPLLRRPFSIHSQERKNIEVFFQITGLGTSLLSQKKIGESLDILGPLGKGFVTGESFQDKVIVAVGGGRGIAPLYFLSQELFSSGASVKIFYGGKSHKDLPLKEKFKKKGLELFCSTDDGSFGYKGFVSDFFKAELEKLNPAFVFACGPEEMMKKIAQITQEKNIPAEFSLESVMGCGFGACWGCVKKIKKKNKEEWTKICEEGPVFSREEIIWTEEEK